LRGYYTRLDKSRPVLDLGIGQGRNAFFLARNGYSVEGVDLSEVAISIVTAAVENEALSVKAHRCAFEDFRSENEHFSGVLILGLIQILTWESITRLVSRVDKWTEPGSLLFATAFTTDDPMYQKCLQEHQTIGRNSFIDENGIVYNFLEPGELLKLFPDCEVIHFWEGMGPWHRHGGSEPERHGRAEAVLRK